MARLELNATLNSLRAIFVYMKKKRIPRYCATCGKLLSKNNKSGYCAQHRDRTGPNNSFYGKTHSEKTRNQLKVSCKNATTKMWKDPEYAAKVKAGLKSEANLLAHTSDEFRKKQSEHAKKQMQDASQLACRSTAMKNSWVTGKLEFNQVRMPNFSKIELKFGEVLGELLGDRKNDLTRKVKIERFDWPKHYYYYCPDYKYHNFLIEIDGDYWHARDRADDEIVHHGLTAKEIREKDAKKDATYTGRGFSVIRIWASDFKRDPETVSQAVFQQITG